jgi:hypothetical protein
MEYKPEELARIAEKNGEGIQDLARERKEKLKKEDPLGFLVQELSNEYEKKLHMDQLSDKWKSVQEAIDSEKSKKFCIDFDNTCTFENFPYVGNEVPGALRVMRRIIDSGHKIVLWTLRSGAAQKNAEEWFIENNIPLLGSQCVPGQKDWTDSPKAAGDYFIDDRNLGCPTIYNTEMDPKPFVDWDRIEQELEKLELI